MKTVLPRISFLYIKNTIYEYVSRRSGGQNLQGSLPITLSFQDLIEGNGNEHQATRCVRSAKKAKAEPPVLLSRRQSSLVQGYNKEVRSFHKNRGVLALVHNEGQSLVTCDEGVRTRGVGRSLCGGMCLASSPCFFQTSMIKKHQTKKVMQI